MNLVDKYRPNTLKEIFGQETAILQLKANIKKPVLLYGSPGTGKTVTAYTFANDLNYEIIELNASDFRNKEEINKIIGNSIKQQSLFKRGKIILVDELDGISGKEDRGGLQALLALIQESTFPVIMVANNAWDSRFYSLRAKSKLIEFKKLNYLTIYKLLLTICKKEKLNIDDKTLRELARISNGDARAAINDLEILSYKNNIDELGERDQERSIFSAIQLILKGSDPGAVLRILDNVSVDLDESLLWLEENVAIEYKDKKDLANAYDLLSKIDVLRGRITRWQHWRFLAYVNDLMTAGIALSKTNKYLGFTKYKKPSRILEIWKHNQKNKLRKDICKKIARKTHNSIKTINQEFLIYKSFINEKIIKELNLSEEEIGFLNFRNI